MSDFADDPTDRTTLIYKQAAFRCQLRLLDVHFSFVGMFSTFSLSATSFSFRIASTKNLSRESSHSSSVSCSRVICVDLCCCGIQCISYSHLNNIFVALPNTFCAIVGVLLRFCIFSFLSCPRTFAVSIFMCSACPNILSPSCHPYALANNAICRAVWNNVHGCHSHRLEDTRRDEIQIRYYCLRWAGHHRRETMRFFSHTQIICLSLQ